MRTTAEKKANRKLGFLRLAMVSSATAIIIAIGMAVAYFNLPGLPPKGDVSDWMADGGTSAALTRLTEATPEWAPPSEEPRPRPGEDGQPPEFLATHPSHGTRIKQIKQWMPEAMSHYHRQPGTTATDLPRLSTAHKF